MTEQQYSAKRISDLMTEVAVWKSRVNALTKRNTELEALIAQKQEVIDAQAYQIMFERSLIYLSPAEREAARNQRKELQDATKA